MAAAPAPTRAAVLGMARTTGTPAPSHPWSRDSVTPAADMGQHPAHPGGGDVAAGGLGVTRLHRHHGAVRPRRLGGRRRHNQAPMPARQALGRRQLIPSSRQCLGDDDLRRLGPAGRQQPADQGLAHLSPTDDHQLWLPLAATLRPPARPDRDVGDAEAPRNLAARLALPRTRNLAPPLGPSARPTVSPATWCSKLPDMLFHYFSVGPGADQRPTFDPMPIVMAGAEKLLSKGAATRPG